MPTWIKRCAAWTKPPYRQSKNRSAPGRDIGFGVFFPTLVSMHCCFERQGGDLLAYASDAVITLLIHCASACSTKNCTIINNIGRATAVSTTCAVSDRQGHVGTALTLLCWISRLMIVPFSFSAAA